MARRGVANGTPGKSASPARSRGTAKGMRAHDHSRCIRDVMASIEGICACRAVAETCLPQDDLRSVASALDDEAAAIGFSISRIVLEAEGVCPNCQTRAEASKQA
ncbi:MAG: hypothetical protein AAF565_02125 [Pseudomonadota bacterium]